ncbi:hypothetical protein [Paenibacillus sp. OV219]|uniref:hypothetical protein n=1 Tax=Paenibacillus sp. OV219 TaxID=1884377 RepID=UPI0008B1EAB9|nr:hypothetical protein [Paenibacillus sp. OV219]SEN28981.1 hypothetical protein SAMN05518847_102601 [Paenibacillus sp. OV219]
MVLTKELTTVQQVMKRWKMNRNALLELVELLPESGGTYRPWDNGMTTIELIHHLALDRTDCGWNAKLYSRSFNRLCS